MAKTFLITGTSSGFGKDTAETLAKADHRVFGTMRAVNGHHGGQAKNWKTKAVEIVELDVTNDSSVDAAFKSLFQKTGGKLDVQRVLRAALPQMRKSHSGLVINIGSIWPCDHPVYGSLRSDQIRS
jgi:NADP-dependent 3-hydroxy acid dehydrogenase YdfG